MSTQDKELEFIDKDNINYSWALEFNQKLTLCLLKIKERSEITEEDYDLLEVLYKRVYSGGDYIITRKALSIPHEVSVQNGLFDIDTHKNGVNDDLGTVVDKIMRKL